MMPCTMVILPAKQYWESLQYSCVASSYIGSHLNSWSPHPVSLDAFETSLKYIRKCHHVIPYLAPGMDLVRAIRWPRNLATQSSSVTWEQRVLWWKSTLTALPYIVPDSCAITEGSDGSLIQFQNTETKKEPYL
jgi:hypothetical protein